jgi:hypothetical protein
MGRQAKGVQSGMQGQRPQADTLTPSRSLSHPIASLSIILFSVPLVVLAMLAFYPVFQHMCGYMHTASCGTHSHFPSLGSFPISLSLSHSPRAI